MICDNKLLNLQHKCFTLINWVRSVLSVAIFEITRVCDSVPYSKSVNRDKPIVIQYGYQVTVVFPSLVKVRSLLKIYYLIYFFL